MPVSSAAAAIDRRTRGTRPGDVGERRAASGADLEVLALVDVGERATGVEFRGPRPDQRRRARLRRRSTPSSRSRPGPGGGRRAGDVRRAPRPSPWSTPASSAVAAVASAVAPWPGRCRSYHQTLRTGASQRTTVRRSSVGIASFNSIDRRSQSPHVAALLTARGLHCALCEAPISRSTSQRAAGRRSQSRPWRCSPLAATVAVVFLLRWLHDRQPPSRRSRRLDQFERRQCFNADASGAVTCAWHRTPRGSTIDLSPRAGASRRRGSSSCRHRFISGAVRCCSATAARELSCPAVKLRFWGPNTVASPPGTSTNCRGIPEVGADNATRCAKARAQSGYAAPTWTVSASPFASLALPWGASAPWPADRCIAERSRRRANGRPLAPQLPMPRVQPWSLVHRSLPFVAPCRVVHRSAPLLIVVARRNERRVVFAAPNVRRLTAGPPSRPASCSPGSPCSARRR